MSASSDSSPGSTPRPFSFGDLGRPRPPGARLLPPIKDPDSELELGADDIIEANEIDTFEVSLASFQPDLDAPAALAAAPAKSSGFEVGDLGPFEDVEVEGLAPRSHTPPPAPAAEAVIARAEAPVSMRVDYASPQPSTLIGMPAAPITSRLPVEASVIVNEPAPAPERTLELKADTVAKVAEKAAFLDGDMPEQTQVLVRSQMPASIQAPATLPTGHTPAPTSVHTPSARLAATSAAWPNGRQPASGPMAAASAHGRPSSVAPVAVDLSRMPSIPAPPRVPHIPGPAKSRTSGLLIGGLIFAAASLIGVVGVGGYVASRSLSDKAESFATTPAPEPVAAAAAAPADPAAADPVAAPADPAAAVPAGIDVSSLPSAPVRAAAASPPVAAAPAAPAAPRAVAGSNGSRATGGASAAMPPPTPTPIGRSGAPLPPPGAANASREAPPPATGGAVALPPPPPKPAAAAAPVVVSSTGNVNVDPKLRAVVVDGSFRRVNDGVLTLSCGTHRIKVGMNDPQVVNVPCGGSVSL